MKKIKVVILGNANSIHIQRWAEGLYSKGVEVHLVTCHRFNFEYSSGIFLYQLTYDAPYGYILSVFQAKLLLRTIKPDLLHAHYVTGYGTLANLIGYKDTLVSAWGADVYDFPRKSLLHRWLVKFNLTRSKGVASTSHAMLDAIKTLCPDLKQTYVTPFGVDIDIFLPSKKNIDSFPIITIGTVKLLHNKYGIDTLIRAFSDFRALAPELESKLVIVGSGPDKKNLEELAMNLNIASFVEFKGYVDNALVPCMLNKFDIFVALSRLDSESFGVAAVEANACGLPVIVSDVSGFKEVVLNGKTGLIVKRDDQIAASKAMLLLALDSNLRQLMGEAGRRHVVDQYSWESSINQMLFVYSELCNDKK
ncbi:glycosyltransferase [Marinomonas primoryensis]|uniref:Glycosyl transferase family 1 n=1 Tax=Marinomonas primoryensis TaxID=178399 RepID=A0A859D0I5_9GAMM|nr:glycosyltransferase [Marinomonas primoryensis]QKK81962.1 uncharacterized protein MP3633_3235 [Marinomonas primoryensis]